MNTDIITALLAAAQNAREILVEARRAALELAEWRRCIAKDPEIAAANARALEIALSRAKGKVSPEKEKLEILQKIADSPDAPGAAGGARIAVEIWNRHAGADDLYDSTDTEKTAFVLKRAALAAGNAEYMLGILESEICPQKTGV